jgi:hypothetical protein
MPQSSKDSKGGKSSAQKKTHSGGQASEASADKKSKSQSGQSPTGSKKHGEKKTTP